MLAGQGTAGQMVPVVLVQPGWLMVVAATEVGWAIPTLAYGTGRALMAGTGRTLAYGLPGMAWQAHRLPRRFLGNQLGQAKS